MYNYLQLFTDEEHELTRFGRRKDLLRTDRRRRLAMPPGQFDAQKKWPPSLSFASRKPLAREATLEIVTTEPQVRRKRYGSLRRKDLLRRSETKVGSSEKMAVTGLVRRSEKVTAKSVLRVEEASCKRGGTGDRHYGEGRLMNGARTIVFLFFFSLK